MRLKPNLAITLAATAVLLASSAVFATAAPLADADIKAALDNAYAKFKDDQDGKNADYIPALAKVDSKIFGLALVTTDGRVFTTGDIKSEVSIQSISKVFTLALVMDQQGVGAKQREDRDAAHHSRPLLTCFKYVCRTAATVFQLPDSPRVVSALTARPHR